MTTTTGGTHSFSCLSLEYNISSSSDSRRYARSISSWRSLQEALHDMNTSNKAKVSRLKRLIKRFLTKLRNGALRLVRLGMFRANPEEALFWFFVTIMDHVPVDMSWLFDSEDWETSSNDSLGLSSCGSWSTFMRRSDSGVGPPPPPHGNFFLRSWSRKSPSRITLSNSVFGLNTNEFDTEGKALASSLKV